jgi:hypothetical protein
MKKNSILKCVCEGDGNKQVFFINLASISRIHFEEFDDKVEILPTLKIFYIGLEEPEVFEGDFALEIESKISEIISDNTTSVPNHIYGID